MIVDDNRMIDIQNRVREVRLSLGERASARDVLEALVAAGIPAPHGEWNMKKVHYWCQKLGVPTTGAKATVEKEDRLAELIVAGFGVAHIRKVTGSSDTLVRRVAQERGLTIVSHDNQHHKKVYTEAELARARTLLSEGMPVKWVLEELGRSTQSFANLLRRVGEIPGHEESVIEWRKVWGSIRFNPELKELHEQFFPAKVA